MSREGRFLEDHFAVRFPTGYRLAGKIVGWVYRRFWDTHAVRLLALRFARRSYATWNRRDLEAMRAMYHPQCVWGATHLNGWPISDTYYGHDGLARVLDDWADAWSDYRLEVIDVKVVPGPRTFVVGMARMSGLSSGIEVTRRWWQVAHQQDGLVSHVENYDDERQALEAVGRRE
jgi:ketosteroid isomerase-like protein